MTSQELYKKMSPATETRYSASYNNDKKLTMNTSDLFSKLIKEAARCSNYNSDVYYDLMTINERLNHFNPDEEFEPIWIGFRRHGVDGTSYVLCNASDEKFYGRLDRTYFALYCITLEPLMLDGKETGLYSIVLSEYPT